MENKTNYWSRFRKFTKADWIVIGFLALFFIVGLYFSIAFSVKLSQGYTLFGDSGNYTGNAIETAGPTSADTAVLTLYWILTVCLGLLLLFLLFIRKPKITHVIRKDIVDGRTIILKDSNTEEKEENHEGK